MKNTLKAFHNDPKIKAKYIARVKAHYDADEIIKVEDINKWYESKRIKN